MTYEEFYGARVLLGEQRIGRRIAAIESEEDQALAQARRFASDV